MRIAKWLGCIVAVTILVAPCLADEESPADESKQQDEMKEMMAAYMKYAMPGEHHEHLKTMVGDWEIKGEFRQSPDAPWGESNSTCKSEWVLDGRFIIQRVKGEPSEMMPMPFEGIGIIGYDNYNGKYTSMWMDTMMTMTMHAEGTCSESGKVFTFSGTYDNLWTGGKTKFRWVDRIISDDQYIFEMYETGPDGKEFMNGKLTFNRKKG